MARKISEAEQFLPAEENNSKPAVTTGHNQQTVTFVLRVRKMWLLYQHPLACIGNMDETPLWLDMPGNTTVSRVGDRIVSVHTTGHDKGRFTVILAAMAMEGNYSLMWCLRE